MPPKNPVNLRKLTYFPDENPFVAPVTIDLEASATTKRRYVQTGQSKRLVDMDTGEVVESTNFVRKVEVKDDESFVKVYADGIIKMLELKSPGKKVFTAVLAAYQKEKMVRGYADCLNLMWFDGGLNGASIGISEDTFHRGLKELIAKDFLRPRMPNVYWINPALLFRGNRIAFVNEYHRAADPAAKAQVNADPRQTDLEDFTK